ncbi:MAG: deoxyribodipyrimidine photolyase [Chitinophagaceae bacterium]|nr:deoxyribodipyrimidine photolyase [Chitinophagaceae bacterium]
MWQEHTPLLNLAQLRERVLAIDPVQYAKTRNFVDGAVSGLSPYISRGVISTRWVYEVLVSAGHAPATMEKLVQELAWRDYWQLRWREYPREIEARSVYQELQFEPRLSMPSAVLHHQTSIQAIDAGIELLYATGRMHNHVRMYTASLCCNISRAHWLVPAQWMYYHLLDADWGSNALSWRWVSGEINGKPYFANQENINFYTHQSQRNTYLDYSYEELPTRAIPDVLVQTEMPVLKTNLPTTPLLNEVMEGDCFIYNYYNLDPQWMAERSGRRILLLEPSVFSQYPISDLNLNWFIQLAQYLIPNIEIITAEFYEIRPMIRGTIYYKEHPFNRYEGVCTERDWLCDFKKSFPSFFAYWKQAKKQLMR